MNFIDYIPVPLESLINLQSMNIIFEGVTDNAEEMQKFLQWLGVFLSNNPPPSTKQHLRVIFKHRLNLAASWLMFRVDMFAQLCQDVDATFQPLLQRPKNSASPPSSWNGVVLTLEFGGVKRNNIARCSSVLAQGFPVLGRHGFLKLEFPTRG